MPSFKHQAPCIPTTHLETVCENNFSCTVLANNTGTTINWNKATSATVLLCIGCSQNTKNCTKHFTKITLVDTAQKT